MRLALLAGVRDARPHALVQDLPLKLGEHGQEADHGTAGRSGQIQSFCERHESDPQLVELLQGPHQVSY